MKSLQIKPVEEKYLKDVVRIHRDVLGYTFNSRLGFEHLPFMYRLMSRNDDSYVGVALLDNQVVGVVSGTLNMDKIRALLINSFKPRQWVVFFSHLLIQPSQICEWWKGNIIGREINYKGTTVQPSLTTIAVDPGFHGKGIGRCLVHGLESYFKTKKITYYRLDTLNMNSNARKFYKSLGFELIESRADAVIYIKRVEHE